MTHTPLNFLDLRDERDIVLARQRARVVAQRLGFESQDQIRIATAVSEVARHAFRSGGLVRVAFLMEGDPGTALGVQVDALQANADDPPGGILTPVELERIGADPEFDGARRMMDGFRVDPAFGGNFTIAMSKSLPRRGRGITAPVAVRLADELIEIIPASPVEELLRQNRDLLRLLDDLRNRELELAQVNRELEETNRGVVALYTELDERADSLKRASELKTRFLANVSHEFRTPLTSILSLGQLLMDGEDGLLNTEQERQVRYILHAASDLSGMVNDLLDLARIESGRDEVYVTEILLVDLFGLLRGMLRPLLPADSAVELLFDVNPAVPTLLTDEGKLVQVVRNLVSNALKFTERGTIRVEAEPTTDGLVAIAVHDTGIGIDPADFERIFEEFGQVDSPLQRKTKGTGLGLPLARRLTELMGGRLEVASLPGVGSTFTAYLPVVYLRPDWTLAPDSAAQFGGYADA